MTKNLRERSDRALDLLDAKRKIIISGKSKFISSEENNMKDICGKVG